MHRVESAMHFSDCNSLATTTYQHTHTHNCLRRMITQSRALAFHWSGFELSISYCFILFHFIMAICMVVYQYIIYENLITYTPNRFFEFLCRTELWIMKWFFFFVCFLFQLQLQHIHTVYPPTGNVLLIFGLYTIFLNATLLNILVCVCLLFSLWLSFVLYGRTFTMCVCVHSLFITHSSNTQMFCCCFGMFYISL